MNARQIREQIEAIDERLQELEPWEEQLVVARRRWLIDESPDARWAVMIIEEGLRPSGGRPASLDLPPLDAGWPGLHATRETITGLKERRALLVEQVPSEAETAAWVKEAEARAANIRRRAEDLAARIA